MAQSVIPFIETLFGYDGVRHHIQNVDLNNYTDSGIYHATGSITHSPNGNYGLLIVINVDSANTIRQIWFPDGSDTFYIRRYYATVWQPWQMVNVTAVN